MYVFLCTALTSPSVVMADLPRPFALLLVLIFPLRQTFHAYQTTYAFFASARDVYALPIPHPTATTTTNTPSLQGKGGVHLPITSPHTITPILLPQFNSRTEIQSLSLTPCLDDSNSVVLAASDAYGRCVVGRFRNTTSNTTRTSENEDEQEHETQALEWTSFDSYSPEALGTNFNIQAEAGWTGLSISPTSPSRSVLARHFPKDVTLFDGPIPVRTLGTLYRPSAVQLLDAPSPTPHPQDPIIAVAEGPQVSIWDFRVGGRGARVARLSPSPHAGHFYCVASSSSSSTNNSNSHLIGAAGADRSVLVWDARTWRIVDRWNNCLKYEATSLHFLQSNPEYCVACGVDYEVVVGRWAGEQRRRLGGGHRTSSAAASVDGGGSGGTDGIGIGTTGTDVGESAKDGGLSFRGDARWMGLGLSAYGGSGGGGETAVRDVMAGLTATKKLYIAEVSPTL